MRKTKLQIWFRKDKNQEIIFLLFIYFLGILFRLVPRLSLDPYLLTLNADIWYRLCLVQYLLDNDHLPTWDIRYLAYGQVPLWYPPLGLYLYAFLAKISALDLPIVMSRIMPFLESLCILPTYFLCRYLYNRNVAILSTIVLSLTPCFVYWTGIATPQSTTIFFIPIILGLWIRYVEAKFLWHNKFVHLFLMGLMMAINFLIHLTFFNLVMILIFSHLGLIYVKKTSWQKFFDLLVPIAISQILTIWWWGPHHLYWWWTQVLTTSPGFFLHIAGAKYLSEHGSLSAFLGYMSFFFIYYLAIKRKASHGYFMIPVFWAIFPLIESHMEDILLLTQKTEWWVHTLIKPLEGFRFYVFLAQPLAICVGLALEEIRLRIRPYASSQKFSRISSILIWVIFIGLLLDILFFYNLSQRFRWHRLEKADIQAAQWFRSHTKKGDRILADDYSAQLFSGIAGGRALLGSMFPLRNVTIPYISGSWIVLYDIHTLYKSMDINEIQTILSKYKCRYVYYSNEVLRRIEYLVNGQGDAKGEREGKYDQLIDIDHSKTLLNPKFFKVVYDHNGRKILKFLKEFNLP